MDQADYAKDAVQREIEMRLAARVRYDGVSANECQNPECGLLISSERQIAAPGCQFCTECAAEIERRGVRR